MSIEEGILLLSALEKANVPYLVILLYAGLNVTLLGQSMNQAAFFRDVNDEMLGKWMHFYGHASKQSSFPSRLNIR